MRVCLTVFEGPTGTFGMERVREAPALLAEALVDLGHEVALMRGKVEAADLRVLFGVQHVPEGTQLAALLGTSDRFVIFQDQDLLAARLDSARGLGLFSAVTLPLLRKASLVWEPREAQVAALRGLGLRVRPLVLGYHPSLRRSHVPTVAADAATLGQGSGSRQTLLDELAASGFEVLDAREEPGPFRDEALARGRVLLSLSGGEGTLSADPVRIVRLLAQGRPVVAREMAGVSAFKDGLTTVPLGEVLGTVRRLLEDPSAWAEASTKAEAWNQAHPMTALLALELRSSGIHGGR